MEADADINAPSSPRGVKAMELMQVLCEILDEFLTFFPQEANFTVEDGMDLPGPHAFPSVIREYTTPMMFIGQFDREQGTIINSLLQLCHRAVKWKSQQATNELDAWPVPIDEPIRLVLGSKLQQDAADPSSPETFNSAVPGFVILHRGEHIGVIENNPLLKPTHAGTLTNSRQDALRDLLSRDQGSIATDPDNNSRESDIAGADD
ncbi:unnamed protein product [Sympodiomycopsis kandeliae]